MIGTWTVVGIRHLTHNQVVAGSSPAGPTENQALTLKSVGAFGFIYVHTIAYR